MLKAASAAGIVWASPALDSVTAHASGTCAYVQLNGSGGLIGTTTAPSADGAAAGCPTVPFCGASGVGSLGASCTFVGGQSSLTGGSWNAGTRTYTAPAGYTILAASARRFVGGASGCALTWPCNGPSSIGLTSVSFPAPATGIYVYFRIVLCS